MSENVDRRDGGNIASNGDVLFLDEERAKRKEHPERPLRKNKPTGLGLNDLRAKMISKMTQMAPPEKTRQIFDGLIDKASQPPDSRPGAKFRKEFGFDEKGYTHGTIFPLNVDLAENVQSVVLPVDLVVQALEEAEYIAILDYCICRKTYGCKDHPVDLGCIFLNSAGRQTVKAGVAKHATLEEAVAHVYKAADSGLVANAEMVEGEQILWGLKNSQMNEFRMICFCCQCCCLAFNVVKNGDIEIKKRYSSCGYTSTIDHTKCVGCHSCANVCPQQCITYREEDQKAVIDQEMCMGCGLCKRKCKSGAIRTLQTMPMRKSVNEYFIKEARIDDGLPHKYDE